MVVEEPPPSTTVWKELRACSLFLGSRGDRKTDNGEDPVTETVTGSAYSQGLESCGYLEWGWLSELSLFFNLVYDYVVKQIYLSS